MIGRIAGQLRVAPAGGVIGIDMLAAMAMADALGVPRAAVAEFLPGIEAEMVRKLCERSRAGGDE